MNVKKTFLHLLIGSVCLSAILGILAILSDLKGWYEIRILFTTVTVSGASLCGLGCGALLERRTQLWLPRAGIFLAILAGTFCILATWEIAEGEWFFKSTGILIALGVGAAHLCLLSLARLASGFRWAQVLAPIVVFGLALWICIIILWELEGDGVFKTLGILSILAGTMTILIPILHRLSQSRGDAGSRREFLTGEIAKLKDKLVHLEDELKSLDR